MYDEDTNRVIAFPRKPLLSLLDIEFDLECPIPCKVMHTVVELNRKISSPWTQTQVKVILLHSRSCFNVAAWHAVCILARESFLLLHIYPTRRNFFCFLQKFHIFSRSEKSWGDKIALRRRQMNNEQRTTKVYKAWGGLSSRQRAKLSTNTLQTDWNI